MQCESGLTFEKARKARAAKTSPHVGQTLRLSRAESTPPGEPCEYAARSTRRSHCVHMRVRVRSFRQHQRTAHVTQVKEAGDTGQSVKPLLGVSGDCHHLVRTVITSCVNEGKYAEATDTRFRVVSVCGYDVNLRSLLVSQGTYETWKTYILGDWAEGKK